MAILKRFCVLAIAALAAACASIPDGTTFQFQTNAERDDAAAQTDVAETAEDADTAGENDSAGPDGEVDAPGTDATGDADAADANHDEIADADAQIETADAGDGETSGGDAADVDVLDTADAADGVDVADSVDVPAACTPGSCDDGIACTTDNCNVSTGCEHAIDNSLCNDSNPCTVDNCDKIKGCLTTFVTTPCDDGSACTSGDACSDGLCKGTKVSCDDGDGCTADSCDISSGCANVVNVSAPCDTGDKCKAKGTCSQAADKSTGKHCIASALNCDDNEVCTADSCDSSSGCTHAAVTGCCTGDATCGPGKVCDTQNHACVQCLTTTNCILGSCDASAVCDVATKTCTFTPKDCSDGNVCTDDGCANGKCTHAANSLDCDDGSGCTFGDFCKDGACNQAKSSQLGMQTSGTGSSDGGLDIIDAGGGAVITTRVANTGARTVEYWNSAGSVMWTHEFASEYSGSVTSEFASGALSQDGSIVVVPGASGKNGTLTAIDTKTGKLAWSSAYDFYGSGDVLRAVASSSSGFAAVGRTVSPLNGLGDAWLLFVKNDGALPKNASLALGSIIAEESAFGIASTGDGGSDWFITGETKGGGNGADLWLLRTDSSGNKLWAVTAGGPLNDRGCNVAASGDGGAAVIGYTGAKGDVPAGQMWLVRFDGSGNRLWDRTFSTNKKLDAWGRGISKMPEGGWILTGATPGASAADLLHWLVRTDAVGNLVWDFKSGDSGVNFGTSVVVLPTGIRSVGGTKNGELSLLRTDVFGNGDCTSSGNCFSKSIADCDDSQNCTGDTCTASTCSSSAFSTGSPCDDGDACSLGDSCAVSGCTPGAPGLWIRTSVSAGANGDAGVGVAEAPDGGYFTIDNVKNGGSFSLTVEKRTQLGENSGGGTWSVSVPGATGNALHVSVDGAGGIVVPATTSGGTQSDGWLGKFDKFGNTVWDGAYGAEKNDSLCAVLPRSGGGYLAAGSYTNSGSGGDSDMWLLSVGADGKQENSWTFLNGGDDFAYGFAASSDGSFWLAGENLASNGAHVRVINVSATGNQIWAYDGPAGTAYDIAATTNGSVVIVDGTNAGQNAMVLIALNVSGTPLWTRAYNGITASSGLGLASLADGGWILTGTNRSAPAVAKLWLVRTDAFGTMQWNQSFTTGAGDDVFGVRVIAPSSGGITAIGKSKFPTGPSGLVLVHTDAYGNATCPVSGGCFTNSAEACNDGNPCTADSCDTSGCTHIPVPDATFCDDGLICTLESCQSGNCAALPVTCQTNATCSEPDGCTCDPHFVGVLANGNTVCAADWPTWGARPIDPTASFTDNGDNTISDSQTGLMWEKSASSDNMTWSEALSSCDSKIISVFNDWRVPTVAELQTLVDYSANNPSWSSVFVGDTIGINSYWTAHESAVVGQYWTLSFNIGTLGYVNPDSVRNNRCVRGTDSNPGNLKYANRFSATATIITDNATGRLWQRVPPSGTYKVVDATVYCAGLNLAGTGWHVPSVTDLAGIVDRTQTNPAIDPLFTDTNGDTFWSSTSQSGAGTNNWYVNFSTGGSYPDASGNAYRVRCVK